MFFQNINYWMVVISGVASMVLGFAWYSPAVFGKRFMKEMKVTAEQMAEHKKNDTNGAMAKRYGLVFLFVLIEAFVISALLNSLVVTSISGLLVLALCVWAGFSLPLSVNNVLFANESKTTLLINSGYQLANAVLVTLIIGIWG